MIISCTRIYAAEYLPKDVWGTSDYTYGIEKLPDNSKGVYMIKDPQSFEIKYIGSSIDINSRLSVHLRTGILKSSDIIRAFLFRPKARQQALFRLEQQLLSKHSPNFNKHPGTPGRPSLEEQLDKLQTFYFYNERFFTPEGCRMIEHMLCKKRIPANCKLSRSILRVMRIYR